MTPQPKIDRIKFQTDLGAYFRDSLTAHFLVYDNGLQWEEPADYHLYNTISGIDTLIVKVGTAVITHQQWNRTCYNVEHISRDLSRLRRDRGLNILLITSGAIGLGRKERRKHEKIPEKESNTPRQKQLDAIAGQPKLFDLWRDYFRSNEQSIGEKLVTHDDLKDMRSSYSLLRDYQDWTHRGLIPVINEDDARSLEEIDIKFKGQRVFRDNDGLASLHAQLLKKSGYKPLIIFLSNTDGIYTKESFENGDYTPIRIVKDSTNLEEQALPMSSARGRGGIISKVEAGRELSEQGIGLVIANGQYCNHDADFQKQRGSARKYDVLDSILEGRVVGTRFIPSNP